MCTTSYFAFSRTDRHACCAEFVCHGAHVGHSLNFGRDVMCNATRIMARNINNVKAQIVRYPRGSLGGKTVVAWSGSFAWNRFQHAQEIDENLSKDIL